MNILQACANPELFAPWFRKPETYQSWFAFLAALFGLEMTEEQAEIYRKHTGRQELPTEPFNEAWLVVGRRGGKSLFMAIAAVFLAAFFDYSKYLVPGERATVMVIAADRRQARTIIRYIKGMLSIIPVLKELVERETADEFELSNSVSIEVGTASFRSTRGYTYAAVLCDEIAFWRTDDAAEPDYAVLDAIRPGMATIPNSMLLCASSPYARKGALWDAFKRYFGKSDGPLVWKASTREMNPTIRESTIARAYERDPAVASAEYGAEFRRDIEAYVSIEALEACTAFGYTDRPFSSRTKYRAFVDPSGGVNDSFTLAVGHSETDKIVLDVVREKKPPLSPEGVIDEFCGILKAYGIREVTGDRYGGEFPREQFRKHGIAYKVAEHVRSDLYRNLLPIINSGRIELLDLPVLRSQLVNLERRVHRGGRETIDHAPNAHDDIANAVAGLASTVAFGKRSPVAASGIQRRN
ncbi:hypothetical protein [Rhizobium sp. TRM95796]|uniref:hypothetical protein n=1 Tax=Rhizobium sp. TRM95796 TaxID=2979862 RepID=UPI0021E81035|nr:hypothetical protein [Rhizobium sp. TRM95796]MCV3764041.1 hypothetical protein [Rhizobium sp. TRM95796]